MSILWRGQQSRDADLNALMRLAREDRFGTGTPFAASPKQATSVVAAGAATNLIADVAGMLPVDEWTGNGPDRRPVSPDPLVRDPEGMGHGFRPFAMRTAREMATHGNAVWQTLVRAGGRSSVVRVVPAVQVKVREAGGSTRWWLYGTEVDPADVHVVVRHPVSGSTLGLSPVAQFAGTLGLAHHAAQFLGQFYADGAHPSAILSLPVPVDETQARTIKDRFVASVRGRREPAVLGGGTTYQPLQLSPVDADLLSSMKWSASETARIWGPGMAEVLGYESGGSMTYSNIESRMIHLLTMALDPYLVAIEQSLSALLASPRVVKFNRGALLRTDLASRYSAHQTGIDAGFLTINEVRALEDRPPVEWGDAPPPNRATPRPQEGTS